MSFGGGGGDEGGNTTIQPYAPAQPGLNQILSEAGTIYGQGPTGAGYVPPSSQTLQGLSAQETMANAANQQILGTIQGQYTNPFLSPMIAQAGQDIYSNVAGQFSGAGRTPTSMGAQNAVIGQVAQKAMPLAFQQLERERNRQLGTAQRVPSLTAVGGELENIQRQQNIAPQMALQQYYNTVGPIGFGLPQTNVQRPQANPIGMAAGGAMSGAAFGGMFPNTIGAGMGGGIGAAFGLLGGLL